MAPLFERIKSFDTSFLEASDGLVTMFDLFGSRVFGFVQSDIKSNIGGVRAYYENHQNSSKTLEDLVRSEAGSHPKHGTACLIRLIRGLALTQHALKHMQDHPSDELHVCFKNAYDVVLRHHHAWVVRGVVNVSMSSHPRRPTSTRFLSLYLSGEPAERFDPELGKWLKALGDIVTRIKDFLEGGGHGKV
ncbi:glycolipid transfer protein [Rhodocollybia butyracea]|uniref:Glycolipid transfer protein n=1 Tax=Rhodocollybia butyracea TaxID=206335 RepID=A0A9P5PVA9_9AGAR|nr:glycolipid transfer protein [Rhodocollybia butyracea]